MQELPLLLREGFHDGADVGSVLIQPDRHLGVDAGIRQCRPGLLLEGCGLRVGAIHLEQDVVADAIDEGAEAARRLNTAGLAKRLHDTKERLLPGVLDLRRRAQTRSQLDRQKMPEIAGEVPLRLRISRRQPIEVRTVELKSPFA